VHYVVHYTISFHNVRSLHQKHKSLIFSSYCSSLCCGLACRSMTINVILIDRNQSSFPSSTWRTRRAFTLAASTPLSGLRYSSTHTKLSPFETWWLLNVTTPTSPYFSGVPRNIFRGGVQQIQLRTEGRESRDRGR
jgi:hypothetical protein